MSALPPKADKQQIARNVRFVPKADKCTAAKLALHHLVGAQRAVKATAFDNSSPRP